MKVAVSFALVLFAVSAAFAAPITPKKLAGPPSEFFSPPSPQASAMDSSHQKIPVFLAPAPSAPRYRECVEVHGAVVQYDSFRVSFPVESTTLFSLSVVSTYLDTFNFSLFSPAGQKVDLSSASVLTKNGEFGIEDNSVPAVTFEFQMGHNGISPGIYSFALTPKEGLSPERKGALYKQSLKERKPVALLYVFNESPLKLSAFLDSYELTVGTELSLDGLIYEAPSASNFRNRSSPSDLFVEESLSGDIDVLMPDGTEEIVHMHSLQSLSTASSNKNVYGASIKLSQEGLYQATTILKGKTATGLPFVRTASKSFRVVSDQLSIARVVPSINFQDMSLVVTLSLKDAAPGAVYRLYGEIFGTKLFASDAVAVAWAGGIVEVSSEGTVSMEASLKWFAKAGAVAPIQIKNLRLESVENYVELASVSSTEKVSLELPRVDFDGEVTEEMTKGKRPDFLSSEEEKAPVGASIGKLILIHGYCAKGNPWETRYFNDYLVFQDYRSNRNNDVFARMILDFASSQGVSVFSMAGHSQGGMAVAHIIQYYWSGADSQYSSGSRIGQSVGTPYLGSSIAGSAADLGDVFGVGCGASDSLNFDGAANWLSGITSATRKQMYFWTTQYKTGGFINYCNLAANVVLKWPNDGVAEQDYSVLAGANNMGHQKAECHSDDLKWPPQCRSASRCAAINSAAGR